VDQLARQTAGGDCQDAHDVGVLEVDDVALGAETLQFGASVLRTAMKSFHSDCTVSIYTQVNRAETARADLSLQSHLPTITYVAINVGPN